MILKVSCGSWPTTTSTVLPIYIMLQRQFLFLQVFFSLLVSTCLALTVNSQNSQNHHPDRRQALQSILQTSITTTATALLTTTVHPAEALATRAVGSGEYECRLQNNCLEKGELDGAIGWSWGGKDRCDATDPNCGTNGKLDSSNSAASLLLPQSDTPISKKLCIDIQIGRQESATIVVGLYDDPYISDFVLPFMTTPGISTVTPTNFQSTIPVSLLGGGGGQITRIDPNKVVELGIPKQSLAYARERGRRDPDFLPQARPPKQAIPVFRASHDAAGLLSVPKNGIGYGGTGFESDDEAFESSILLTASPMPSLDTTHRVIGQVLDESSLQNLARIARIPTNKGGVRGVLPGQNDGPPLLKTTIRDVRVL